MCSQHAAELSALQKQLASARAHISALETRVSEATDAVSSLEQKHAHAITSLEKTLVQSLSEAFEAARSRHVAA